jgi:hypothetical protein
MPPRHVFDAGRGILPAVLSRQRLIALRVSRFRPRLSARPAGRLRRRVDLGQRSRQLFSIRARHVVWVNDVGIVFFFALIRWRWRKPRWEWGPATACRAALPVAAAIGPAWSCRSHATSRLSTMPVNICKGGGWVAACAIDIPGSSSLPG